MKKTIITSLLISTISSCNDNTNQLTKTPKPKTKNLSQEEEKNLNAWIDASTDDFLKLEIPPSQGPGTRQHAGVQSLQELQTFLNESRDSFKEKISKLTKSKGTIIMKLMKKIATSLCKKCKAHHHSHNFADLKKIIEDNFSIFITLNEEQLEALNTIPEDVFDISYAATNHHSTSFDESRIITLLRCTNIHTLKTLCQYKPKATDKFTTEKLKELAAITNPTELEAKIQAIENC